MMNIEHHQPAINDDHIVTPPTTIPESSSMASVSTAADFFVTAPSPPTSPNNLSSITSLTEVVQSADQDPTNASLALPPMLNPSPVQTTPPLLGLSTPPLDDTIAYDFTTRASHRASNPFDLGLVSSSDGDERSLKSVPSRLASPLASDRETKPEVKATYSSTELSSPTYREQEQEVEPAPHHSNLDMPEEEAQQTLRGRRGVGPELALVEELSTILPTEEKMSTSVREASATSSPLMSPGTATSAGGEWSGIGWMLADVAESPSPSSSSTPISQPATPGMAAGGSNDVQTRRAPTEEEKRRTRLNRRTGRLFSHGSHSPTLSDISALESSPSFPSSPASKLAAVREAARMEEEEPQWEMVGGPVEKTSTPPPDAAEIVANHSVTASSTCVDREEEFNVGKSDSSGFAHPSETDDELASDDEEWDIYADYARESMFLPPGTLLSAEQRKSLRAVARASRIKSGRMSRMKAATSPLQEAESSFVGAAEISFVGAADKDMVNDDSATSQPAQVATPARTSSSMAIQAIPGLPPLPPKAEARPRAVNLRANVKEASDPSHATVPLEALSLKSTDTLVPTVQSALDPPPTQSLSIRPLVPSPQEVSPRVTTPILTSISSPPKPEARLGPSTPASVTVTPRSYDQSPATPASNHSPHTTSIGATKIAQSRRDVSLHGELAQDLASAKNPVPIQFLVGDAMFIRSRVAVNQYRPAEVSSSSPCEGAARIGLGLGLPPHSGPAFVKQPSSAHARPARPAPQFTQAKMERPRSKSFSSMDKIEVPLPMHRSGSSNSLAQAYQDMGENGPSTASRAVTLMRKVSRKRSNSSATSHNDRPLKSVPATPKLPTSVHSPMSGMKTESPQLLQTPNPSSSSPASTTPRIPPIRTTLSPVVTSPLQGRLPLNTQGSSRSPVTPTFRSSPLESALTRTKSAVPESPLTPRTPPTASPISSKDYHRTVNQDGADFQMAGDHRPTGGPFAAFDSSAESDEWGFIGNSAVPVIYGMTAKEKKALPKLEQTLVSQLSLLRGRHTLTCSVP